MFYLIWIQSDVSLLFVKVFFFLKYRFDLLGMSFLRNKFRTNVFTLFFKILQRHSADFIKTLISFTSKILNMHIQQQFFDYTIFLQNSLPPHTNLNVPINQFKTSVSRFLMYKPDAKIYISKDILTTYLTSQNLNRFLNKIIILLYANNL